MIYTNCLPCREGQAGSPESENASDGGEVVNIMKPPSAYPTTTSETTLPTVPFNIPLYVYVPMTSAVMPPVNGGPQQVYAASTRVVTRAEIGPGVQSYASTPPTSAVSPAGQFYGGSSPPATVIGENNNVYYSNHGGSEGQYGSSSVLVSSDRFTNKSGTCGGKNAQRPILSPMPEQVAAAEPKPTMTLVNRPAQSQSGSVVTSTITPPSTYVDNSTTPPSNMRPSRPASTTSTSSHCCASCEQSPYHNIGPLFSRMEIVWHGEFDRLFAQYYNKWYLIPTLQSPSCRWKMFKDSAKVRFCCSNCGHGWTSMKGRVAFWFHLDQQTGSGYVMFKLFGQCCMKCQIGNFEHAMWYPEEVIKVVGNVYNRIGQEFYGFVRPPLRVDRRVGKPRNQHNSKLCQACQDGICREEFTVS